MNNWTRVEQTVRQIVQMIAKACDLASEDFDALDDQLQWAVVDSDSPTMIDVEVPPGIPKLALPNGPLPVGAYVMDREGEVIGEILVWVKDGVLRGIEQAWYTDGAPTSWPSPDRIKFQR